MTWTPHLPVAFGGAFADFDAAIADAFEAESTEETETTLLLCAVLTGQSFLVGSVV